MLLGSEQGWYSIAWAFLKPVGANGVRNVNRKVRLQLFEPESLPKSKLQPGPEVFYQIFHRTSISIFV